MQTVQAKAITCEGYVLDKDMGRWADKLMLAGNIRLLERPSGA